MTEYEISEWERLSEGYEGIVSHGMTVNDQSTADAFDEILGAGSSEGERHGDIVEVAGSTPARPTELDEPPVEEDDWPLPLVKPEDTSPAEWPEPEPAVPLYPEPVHALHSDQRPAVGVHYVIFDGVPRPVVRELLITEDEFVRENLGEEADGLRRQRADRALRLRYRGWLCGEITSL